MGMNTQKILELLGTTSESKMKTLARQESFPICAEEGANELLNSDLFGVPVQRKAAKESAIASKPLPTAVKSKLTARAKENMEEEIAPLEEPVVDATPVEEPAPSDVLRDAVRGYLDSLGEEIDSETARTEVTVVVDEVFAERYPQDATADEAAAAESSKVAEETVVETTDSKFPEEFDFDEESFANEYGIDKETITCLFVPEDPDAQVAEHIEISFDYEGSKITLSISADSVVSETVDAEEVDAQFSAAFVQRENEDGTSEDVLELTLIEEAEDSDTLKSEEDSLTKSEGDEAHKDEEGNDITDEFVEEAGLNLDPFYSKHHDMPLADKGAHEIKANESLAAKLIRNRK